MIIASPQPSDAMQQQDATVQKAVTAADCPHDVYHAHGSGMVQQDLGTEESNGKCLATVGVITAIPQKILSGSLHPSEHL